MQGKVYLFDLAVMSKRAYHTGSEELSSGWREEPAQIYEASARDYLTLPFVHDKEKIVVLANRGTSSPANLVNDDLKIALGKLFPYYQHTLGVANLYLQKYKGYTLLHTGHSLGAATATLVAATRGEHAVGFDSPGVQQIVDTNPDIARSIKKEAAITLYQSEPNIVNTCGKHFAHAKVIAIKPCPQVVTKLSEFKQRLQKDVSFEHFFVNPAVEKGAQDLLILSEYNSFAHSLENILLSLKHSAVETYTIKSGDTLSGIAKSRYGIVSEWKRLHESNKATLGDNPDVIKPGKVIEIRLYTPKS